MFLLSTCNDRSSRKEAIINAIQSAGDFDIAQLSREDQALISEEYAPESNFEIEEQETILVKESNSNQKSAFHNRKLIKTGSIKYESDNMNKSRIEIEKLVKKHNAFISNEKSNNYNYRKEQELSVRIPFDNFDKFINDLSSSVSEFDFKNINVTDVTEEYIDVQSRLKAKYKLEESFLALLKKALKIKDILEIEKELNNVRSSIETMEGRLRYLKDQVSLSTLHINFYKTSSREYKKEKGFFSKLWYNFQSGFSGLLAFTLGIVSVWPFIIIVSVIIYFIRRFFRNRKK